MTKVFKDKIWFVSLNMCYNVLCVNTIHSEQNMHFLKLDMYVVAESNTSLEIIDFLDLQKIFITRGRERIIPRQPNCGSHEP